MVHAQVDDLLAGRNGSVRWQALPDWEPMLFGPKGLRLEEWRSQGRLQVVKHGVHRTVYRVELSGRAFFVKQYRRERFLDAISHLVRPSAARREWHNAAEVARRGIRTVKPVAWAERVGGGMVRDNYLVTEAIHRACDLERYIEDQLPQLPPNAQATLRREIVEGLARFVAAIHRVGIFDNDFHVGNILLRLDTCPPGTPPNDAAPEFHLIDLPGVRFSGPLKWPASRASLIMFAAGWWLRTSPGERLRFWKTYLSQRPDLELPEPRSAIGQLERGGREYCRRVARRRDKRALRTNRHYLAVRQARGKAHGVVELGRAELGRILDDPEGLLVRNLDRPVKLSHSKLIVEAELPVDGKAVHVAYARFRYRNGWKAVLGSFRRSRAVRGWYMGHALLARRIATARPVAVCQVRGRRYGFQQYLATEWIEGAENLHLYGWRLARQGPTDRLRRAARSAESLGELIGRMHANQIAHGDLKASNLLVVEGDGKPQTYLIDAEDVRIAGRLTSAQRVADLARLATSLQAHPWVTPTILCRFIQAYVQQFPPGTLPWKPLWRRVARRSRRIVRRKRGRGRQVL